MMELNKEKIQIKYLTSINKTFEDYPTSLDILFDSCCESLDGAFYSEAKLENKYGLNEEQIKQVIMELEGLGYIEKKTKNYRIVKTPWS